MVSFGDSDEDDYQDAAQDTCTSTAASFGSRGAPDPIEVRMRSGRALYEAKDFKAAEVSFLDAFRFAEQTQIKPSVVQAANNVAACSLRRGAYNEVRLWTDHVLKVRLSAARNRGWRHLDRLHVKAEDESLLTDSLLIFRTSDHWACCCVFSAELVGYYTHSRKYSLQVDPDNLKALYRRWLAFTKLGKSSEAAETLSALDELSLRVTLQSKTDGEKHAIVVDVASELELGDRLQVHAESCSSMQYKTNTIF